MQGRPREVALAGLGRLTALGPRYLRQQAAQHSCGGLQHSPSSQQSLTFAFVLAELQHSCAGLQQSPSGQQLAAFALALPEKQQACGGLQQSAPGAQQLTSTPDMPPLKMPRRSAKGASSFKAITDLQPFKW